MTKRNLPRTITVAGQRLVKTPHPNPAFTAWIGLGISVLYSREWDHDHDVWHVSICRTLQPPTDQMLRDAVEAIVGPGTAYEVEPTANPNVLHAFEPEVIPA